MSSDAVAGFRINLLSGKRFADVFELLEGNEAIKSAPLKPEFDFQDNPLAAGGVKGRSKFSTQLHKALITNNLEEINRIISQYPEILTKPVFIDKNGQKFFADRFVFSYEAFKLLVEKGCNITKDMLQEAIPHFIEISNKSPAATQEQIKDAKAALNYIAEQYNLELLETEEPTPGWFASKQYIEALANDLMKQLAERDLLGKPLPQFTEQHPDHTILDIPEATFADHQYPATAIPDTPVGSVANMEFDGEITLL